MVKQSWSPRTLRGLGNVAVGWDGDQECGNPWDTHTHTLFQYILSIDITALLLFLIVPSASHHILFIWIVQYQFNHSQCPCSVMHVWRPGVGDVLERRPRCDSLYSTLTVPEFTYPWRYCLHNTYGLLLWIIDVGTGILRDFSVWPFSVWWSWANRTLATLYEKDSTCTKVSVGKQSETKMMCNLRQFCKMSPSFPPSLLRQASPYPTNADINASCYPPANPCHASSYPLHTTSSRLTQTPSYIDPRSCVRSVWARSSS